MSSHTHRLMSNHTTFELPEDHKTAALSPSPENGAFAIDANPKSPRCAAEPALAGLDGAHPLHPRSDYPSSRTRSAKRAWALPNCATRAEAASGDSSRSFTTGID